LLNDPIQMMGMAPVLRLVARLKVLKVAITSVTLMTRVIFRLTVSLIFKKMVIITNYRGFLMEE
jgi:hypothetical protein